MFDVRGAGSVVRRSPRRHIIDTVRGPEPSGDRSPIEGQTITGPCDVTVDLTSEIRWFFDGPLPPSILTWFGRSGAGLIEDRCDTYRLDRQVDTGVKRRFRTTLELKLRLGPPEPFTTGRLQGQLETWKRWSPADGRVNLDETTVWVDVDKTVIKRRFDRDGAELALDESRRAMIGDGCDAEIAAISVNTLQAWTFALAAFGRPEEHRTLLANAWQALAADRPDANELRLVRDRSCGYPEWLARAAAIPTRTRPDRLGSISDPG